MLARERSAIADNEIRGSMDERTIFFNARFTHQVEIDSRMHTALAEMAVQRTSVSELGEKLSQIAQIIPQFFRRHRGIFPALPRILGVGNPSRRAQSRPPHQPDRPLLFGIVEKLHARWVLGVF